MGFALIWIESMAAALLLVGLVSACAGRWRRGWQVLAVLTGVLVLAPAAAYTWGLRLLSVRGVVGDGKFYESLAWVVVFGVGAAVVVSFGARRLRDVEGPAARTWPRGRLAAALGLVVILNVITFSNMDLAVKVQMNAERAEAGAKILSLTPPRPADQDNAALVYQEAFDALTPHDRLPTPSKEKAAAWFEVAAEFDFQDKDLTEFLRGQDRGLTLLRKASAFPGCSFERDYFLSIGMPLTELSRMREGAVLLALEARTRARRGDAAGALEDVAAVFGMARHSNEPVLISLITSAAIDRIGTAALEDVLAHCAPKPEDLTRLTLRDASYARGLQRTFQMEEVAFGVPLFALATTGTGVSSPTLKEVMDPSGTWVLDTPLYRVYFVADDLAAYRRHLKSFQELAGRPYHEARPDWEREENAIKATRGGGILAGLLIPASIKVVEIAARTEATHRVSQLAVAAEAYRAKQGKLPERLDDLTPAFLPRLPADPFTGQRLIAKADGKDLVLYSVGPDGKDDGGSPWNEEKRTGDLVFRLRGR